MNALTLTFPWTRYSKKLAARIDKLRCMGLFTASESEARDMHLAEGVAGSLEDGNLIHLYWLVDRDDGIIVDAKFQAFGQSALLGAAEIACELVVGKNYDQAKRISSNLIDQQVQDKAGCAAFPQETLPHLNLVLEAMEAASEQCAGIPLAMTYVAPPMPLEMGEILEGGYPGWLEMSTDQKLLVVEEVLDRDIRPYIALDGGGVEVLNLLNNTELVIAYQGSCTSCYSSVGTTLSYIQQMLRAKVHPNIVVVPNLNYSER
ncbi:MAG: NifU family protein [Parachlamydiaceae bacterium]|nr:NifU family protein [Parachlamydiaceae bacterium]